MKNSVYCKSLFQLPDNVHYFCGHSLGPITHVAKKQLQQALNEWETKQVNAWEYANWIDLPIQCGEKIAPLIGAKAHEVMVCDNTTLNLLKVLLSALSVNNTRKVILTEQGNFPTDNYIAQSVAKLQAISLKILPKAEILDALDESVAVLLLTQVDYKTAQKWDLASVTQKAHEKGIIVVWDLSHSVGVMPIDCAKHQIDFAVGCTYKYLNGGPGAPSFIYVNEKHHSIEPGVQGWMGHQRPFAFSDEYLPAAGIKRYLSGTPSILSMSALLGALSVYEHLDLNTIEQSNQALSDYFISLCQQRLPALQMISPMNKQLRGGHVAFSHPKALDIGNALMRDGVKIDTRGQVIRFGLSPLYLSQKDIDTAVNKLAIILSNLQSVPNILSPASPNPGQI